MFTRRNWMARAAAGAVVLVAGRPLGVLAERKPEVRIYRRHFTQCCTGYMAHLRENGFSVEEVTVTDLAAIKADYAIPESLTSCHTAVCSGYVIEGHVPGVVIHKLLKDRPLLKGLAVAGVPSGAAGTEAVPNRKPISIVSIGPTNEIKPYTTW